MTFRWRLTLTFALVFLLGTLGIGAGVYAFTGQSLRASQDDTLRQASDLARAGLKGEDGSYKLENKLRGDLGVEVLTMQGKTVFKEGDTSDHPPHSLVEGFHTEGSSRALVSSLGEGHLLRVSTSTEHTDEVLETLLRILLAGSGVGALLSLGAGYLLAGRALGPIDAVTRTAQSIAAQGDYSERVPQAAGSDELARLTLTVNDMLDKLGHTIDREKQFARIAAHELRTPLTTLRGRLELTLERPRTAAEYEKALTGMQERVEALGSLTESLLALARTDAPVRLERVSLSSVALKVAENWEDVAAAQGKPLVLNIEEGWVQAEAEGLERVVSNLLENALKYGEGPVILQVRGPLLSVENVGAGPDREAWDRLLQPFERGAGLQGVSGSGLGLALVAALVRRWEAELRPVWSGKTFTVQVAFKEAP